MGSGQAVQLFRLLVGRQKVLLCAWQPSATRCPLLYQQETPFVGQEVRLCHWLGARIRRDFLILSGQRYFRSWYIKPRARKQRDRRALRTEETPAGQGGQEPHGHYCKLW